MHRPFRKCALPQCSGLRFNLVHKFPRRHDRLQQWLDAIASPRLSSLPHDRLNLLWICCRHFRVEDYVNPQSKTLNVAAVPSLNLQTLDDLDKCRQGDVEKAAVLTAEEIIWLQENSNKRQIELLKPHASGFNQQIVKGPPMKDSSIVSTTTTPLPTVSTKSLDEPPVSQTCSYASINTIESTPSVCATTSVSCVGEDTNDFTLFLDDGYIEINDYKLGRNYELNSLWLRSLCHCSKCYDVKTDVPKLNVFELPRDVQPIMANVSEETTKLEIVWDDGHTSTYDLNDIYEKTQSKKKLTTPIHNQILWNGQNTKSGDDFQPLPCYDILMDSSNIIPTALKRLQKVGVLIITALPRSDTDSVLKRTLISKLFNHVWDNLISEKRSHFCATHNTPYTNCTFESMDKGLQMLTVPYHKENIKIKLCLVDGFYAASQLQQLHKVSYDFLSQYIMEYSFKDKQGYCHGTKETVINIKDGCERILFSPYHLQDVKAQDFDMIANHSKNFNDLLKANENQWHIDLDSEMLIILDNFRICWCISEPHIENELDCFYMERRHYISSLHQLKP
ncbi:trimethyllysine dioxygenase, mitochondrial-like [Haematobia irritans]|uniref:trimethyllysine dioxygenase, mitochondrial-like n=1 Tax=Haematobia irritans TaxID=7368 RepID=UPI003F500E4A